jgi:hypothetical protein
VCTSVAVASPTTTVPATTTETTATASVAPASSTNATADQEIAQSGPLSDVPEGHWAYDAVAQLVKDGLIKGYPDGSFKGNRPMTRYEAAVLTYRAVDQIEAQITAGKAVAQADIDAVKKLAAAFAAELKQVEAHVAALQKTVDNQGKQITSLKAEADATQLRVNAGKVGFNEVVHPGTSSFQLNGQTAAGTAIAPGTSVKFGSGAAVTAPAGTINTGVMYNLARFYVGGQIDPRWSYGVRISDAVTYTPFGTTSISPANCPATTLPASGQNCAYASLSGGNFPIRLDYAYVAYNSPGGLGFQIGRYSVGAYGKFGSTPFGSMLFGGQQATGASLLYNDPAGKLYGAFYYNQAVLNQTTLNAASTSYSASTITVPAGGFAPGSTVTVPAPATVTTNQCGVTVASTGTIPATTVINGTGTVYGLNNGVGGGYNGINSLCNSPQQEFGGWGVYDFAHALGTNNIAIGGAVDYKTGTPYTFYDPNASTCIAGPGGNPAARGTTLAASAGDCLSNGYGVSAVAPANKYITGEANIMAVEGYLGAFIGKNFLAQFIYAYNLTQSPFYSGGNLPGADSESVAFTYASKGNLYTGGGYTNPWITGGGRKNSNVASIYAARFGVNSLAGIQNTDLAGATPFSNNTGLQSSGVQFAGIQLGHWFSDSIRFGVNAFHIQQVGGLAGTSGIPTTAGGFVNQINENQGNAEMYFYFF